MADSFAANDSSNADPVDLEQLTMISEGDAEFEKVLIESFFQSVGESVELLEGHMADRDWEKCQRDAHKIKGSSATLGAKRLCQIALELEETCRDVAGDQVGLMVLAIREEYERVWTFLDQRLDGDR